MLKGLDAQCRTEIQIDWYDWYDGSLVILEQHRSTANIIPMDRGFHSHGMSWATPSRVMEIEVDEARLLT